MLIIEKGEEMKKVLAISLILAVIIVLCFSAVSCKVQSEKTQATAEKAQTENTQVAAEESETTQAVENNPWTGKKIALSVPNTGWPYISIFDTIFESEAKDNGMEAIIISADSDELKQSNDIQDSIVKKVDFIDVISVGTVSIIDPAKKANEAGIPIMFSINPPDEKALEYAVCYSGPDVLVQGRLCAREMAHALGFSGKTVMLQGFLGQPAEVLTTQGIEEELAVYAPDIEIVEKQPYDWDPAKAQSVVESFLSKYPDIDGIFVGDIGAAAAVCSVLEQKGYAPGDIKITTLGGTKDGIEKIREGWIHATVDQPPDIAAAQDIRLIKKYFAGEELQKWNQMPMSVWTQLNVGILEGY